MTLSPEQQAQLDAQQQAMLDRIAAKVATWNQPQPDVAESQDPGARETDPFDFTESDKAEFQRTDGLKAHAQVAVNHGFHIFGLMPKDKVPLPGSRGFKDSKSPLDPLVLAPWDQDPSRNIGIDLGASDL